MKSIEQQLEEEKKVNQAIVDLLDEALQKVGYSDDVINGLTISGKVDFLVKAVQRGQVDEVDILPKSGEYYIEYVESHIVRLRPRRQDATYGDDGDSRHGS